jgi:hypothetical protein
MRQDAYAGGIKRQSMLTADVAADYWQKCQSALINQGRTELSLPEAFQQNKKGVANVAGNSPFILTCSNPRLAGC